MYSLPLELYSKIFDHVLKLSDKINLIFINKIFFDMFKKELIIFINEFNKLHVPNKKKYSYIEKIILRCCYDGYPYLFDKTLISSELNNICDIFIKYGHVDLLQISYDNGCKLEKQYVCQVAAKYGRLEIIKWARENGCDW